jgi:hypothetical protein
MSVGNPIKPNPSPQSNIIIDERQPLLVPSSSSSSLSSGNGDFTTTDLEDQRKIERQDELGWKSYTFYGILLVIGLLVLTLLVKGFIDAGDVEVSPFF